MNNPDDHEAIHAELRALKSELNEWALGIRCVFTALNLLPLYYCTRVLLAAPRFQMIFEDMLGSRDKLPPLTRFIIEWSVPLLGLTYLLAAGMITLIFIVKQARLVWIPAAASAFVLIASGHFVATVLMDPLVTVIQNLSGGGEVSP